MIYLIVILIISHFIVLYYINKFINAYKLNNHNYINSELKKLQVQFSKGLDTIDNNINRLNEKSNQSFERLEAENTNFIKRHTTNFGQVTNFIKEDYHSLTQLLKKNNELLTTLLQKTKENITKNRELKPLLMNSSNELEKVYGKIKMLITNYEKNINDIRDEMENSLHLIESTIESKIKQLAVNGEKIMLDSVKNSKNTITKVTEETNNSLKKVLKENQINTLTEKVKILDEEFKKRLAEVEQHISKLDETFIAKFKEFLETKKNSKGKSPFDDLKKWWDS